MVLKNAGQRGGQIGGEVANGAEGLVVGDEDCQVLCGGKSRANVCSLDSTQSSSEVGSAKGVGNRLGNAQDLVDDVDGTSGEVDIAGRDGRVFSQGRVECDVAPNSLGLNALTASDVGVSLVGEQGGDELRLFGELGGVVGAVQDVVLKNRGDEAGISRSTLSTRACEECLEGGIARCQDGDVLCLGKGFDQSRLGAEKCCETLEGQFRVRLVMGRWIAYL